MNELIFGKSSLKNIVSVEPNSTHVEVFFEKEDGSIISEFKSHHYWTLTPFKTNKSIMLEGDNHYKHITYFDDYTGLKKFKEWAYSRRADFFGITDPKESVLVHNGASYFKGMKVEDVSVLSFDIESTGLVHDNNSRVVLITNTLRKKGVIERKVFFCLDYETDADMFDDWCRWVREKNPSVILGHNIFMYDLPYMYHCAKKAGTDLYLGRDGSKVRFSNRESMFRKDGSQSYPYKKVRIYGRELIDTFFVAVKYDIGRKYISYGLKSIIKQEGLEVKDRVFYEASKIKDNYRDPNEIEKIKEYAIKDADDSLALYDLMIPSIFYMTQSVPKSFQAMIESASGSQLNSFLIRGYLQDKHSIPKTTELTEHVKGGISFAVPGVYKNLYKVDLKSAYPSQILRFKLYDNKKDPKMYFYHMCKYFTEQRLRYKELAKSTGEKYYEDLQAAGKIFINSQYGLCNTPGLNFNSPELAKKITEETRNVIETALVWASGKGKDYWMSVFEEKTK